MRRLGLTLLLATGLSCGVTTEVGATTTTHADGIIAGQLGYEGGAYPGAFHPTAGVVKFSVQNHVHQVKVPESGAFTVRVAPGNYTLVGCGGTKNKQCGPTQGVAVQSGTTTQVQVPWLLAP